VWVPEFFPRGLKQPGHEIKYLPPSTAKDKKDCSPHVPYGVDRENFPLLRNCHGKYVAKHCVVSVFMLLH